MATSFYLPSSIDEACSLLAEWQERATITNGGTDIVIEISKGRLTPCANICIWNIEELHEIVQKGAYVSVGGAATYDEIMASPLTQAFPGLIEAVSQIGSPAIRSVATLAGNICTAAPAPDGCTMAMALDAQAVLKSTEGERTVPMSEMLLGRGKTERASNELLKEILLPIPGKICAYNRIARRRAQDIAKVMVGVSLEIEDDICKKAVISLGALNAVPCRAYSAEELLQGAPVREGLDRLQGFMPKEAAPRQSQFKRYKEQVLPTLLARTAEAAAQRGGA